MNIHDKDVLERFLNFSTQSPSHANILQEFSTLNNSSVCILSDDNKGFAYVPGKRNDRVLLVASLEFGLDYTNQEIPTFKNGYYITSGQKSFLDIAVASSAILYLLKDSGHSLLVINDKDTWDLFVPDVITTIREQHKDLFEEFNSHQYVLEFNYRNYRSLDFVLPVTHDFRNFIEDNTSFFEEHDDEMCPPLMRSNIHALCERICGANISAGYHKNRKRGAFLNLAEWKHTLNVFRNLLKEPQPRFPLSYYVSHSNDSGLPNFREQ